ncbi:MAG: aminopeptidase P family protein [Candidatus Lokiarchaeota archaeon]|nr:aminopeptidase P family protein [Candidatus Lokiarchaeota archaeon]
MNKFEKAQQILQEINGDGWLIVCNEDNDIHSRYLLGVGSHALHAIFIATDGNHKVLPVAMEANMVKNSLKKKGLDAEVIPFNSESEFMEKLKLIIKKPKIALDFGENIFEKDTTSYADYIPFGTHLALQKLAPNTEFISAAPIIYELRSVKSTEELKDLRNVCKATIELLEKVPDMTKVGITERELMAKLEYEYAKVGKPAFSAIVGTGENSADPHHNTSNKKINPGPLLIDTGLQIDEMCSDITWTYWVGSNPSREFIDAYNALYEAKKIANKYYTDGTPNRLPAMKCREYLAEKGYDHEKLFFHGLGHALDFEAHGVGPRVSSKSPENTLLKENMVYTNEPGLYWIGKWGVRLEDDIIIGKEKCEQVTYVPKDPIVM